VTFRFRNKAKLEYSWAALPGDVGCTMYGMYECTPTFGACRVQRGRTYNEQ